MSDLLTPLSGVSAAVPTKAGESREEIAKVAQQFEALMLHQLLKSSKGSDESWLGTGEQDEAGLQAIELAQEHFAEALAARGGLGLAQMITSRLMDK